MHYPTESVGDLTGYELGDYVVLELIGSGGGGQVYKARHRHMGRTVALKILPPETMSHPLALKRFEREVRAAARLIHANIVTAFDAGRHASIHYLAMEYVAGRSLSEVVRRDGPLPVGRAVDYAIKIATGLAYAHRKGIIHRDVKPSNVMLSDDDEIKILDMGLARSREISTHGESPTAGTLTEHGFVVGSLGYMSSEQATGAPDVDHRTDIYSLGCTLFFLLTGNTPYAGSLLQTIAAQAKETTPSLRSFRPDVPRGLDALFQQMIARLPADRIQQMDDVVTQLQPWLAVESTGPVRLESPSTRAASKDATQTSSSTHTTVPKAVGFDLGTVNSYVSCLGTDGVPCSVLNESGQVSTPTMVRFHERRFECGQRVVDNVSQGVSDIAAYFIGQMGLAGITWDLAGRPVPPEVAAAVLVRSLAADVRRHLGYFSHGCYTLPTCLGDRRRHAYRAAFEMGSIRPLAPLNSATASAAYFAFVHGWLNPARSFPPRRLLVIRYGAASFDASLIHVAGQYLNTLAVIGDPTFGGQQWTDRMIDYVAEQLSKQHRVNVFDDPVELFRLRRSCEQAKLALSGQERVELRFRTRRKTLGGTLTRSFLQRLCQDRLDRLAELLSACLATANTRFADVDHVLLTGGAAHTPIVRDFVAALVGAPQRCLAVDPTFAPHGAALYALAQIDPDCRTCQLAITERTAHFYGIESTQDGRIKRTVIVPIGTELPSIQTVKFKTSEPDQRSVQLQIIEGTDLRGTDCASIGVCKISNLPPGLPAATPLELEFHLAKDGTLSVYYESPSLGQRTSLPIERTVGMRPEECVSWRNWLDTGQLLGQFD